MINRSKDIFFCVALLALISMAACSKKPSDNEGTQPSPAFTNLFITINEQEGLI
jgi:hypothetical protein